MYLSVVELPVYVDLSLCDVASEVGDGMGDIWTERGVGEAVRGKTVRERVGEGGGGEEGEGKGKARRVTGRC